MHPLNKFKSYPIAVLDSLEEYVAHLKYAVKAWTFSELIDTKSKWQTDTPEECLKVVENEIILRDKLAKHERGSNKV